ncbi:MAG: phenylpyruvate tautomerase MIF-related protein [Alphaproteobacteria bacterium]
MPFLNIYTNSKIDEKTKADFLYDSAVLLAKSLNKPVEHMVINFIKNSDILFGNDFEERGALVELKAIGFPENKAEIAKVLSKLLAERLEIELDFVYIEWIDMSVETVSFGGKFRG